jgi:hypothetical protein
MVLQIYEEAWPTHAYLNYNSPKDAEYETNIFETVGRKKSCFELGYTGNMDNVPLIFNVPSNRTVNTEGAISIKIKSSDHDKTNYMASLACCADAKNCLCC